MATRNSSSPLHQQHGSTLLDEIAAGRFPPGDRLPSEMDLAQELKVSRGVVRELLRRLEDRGVVKISHGRGARVQQVSSWNVLDAEVLSAIMPTTASVSILADYLECRRILETEAAALAAQRAFSGDLSDMADAFARMKASARAVDPAEEADAQVRFHEADIAFHSAIFRASGNQVLPHVIEPIQRVMGTLLDRLARPENRVEKSLPEHKAILSAIAERDVDGARKAMETHLATVGVYLQEYRLEMEPQTGP